MGGTNGGVAVEPVTAWFQANVGGVEPPLEFALIAGGRSNLTFRVTDRAGHRYVLRRPPLGQILATAHDMGREYRIISALGSTPVPVPPAIGFCDDAAVNDQPFYVMGFVEGTIARDVDTVRAALTPQQRRIASESLVDVLADIHAVDIDRVGLGDLARREGYIDRQLRRWHSQFTQSKSREIPLVDSVHERLAKLIPDQGPATIVHGDYRLDNTMIGADGRVSAVLDWELCTLGDPLADVGLLMVYWAEAADPGPAALVGAATTLDGFATRAELRARYAARSGRDVEHLDFYIAFAYWKLACILEGVYSRYVAGVMGQDGAAFETMTGQVGYLAERADLALDAMP
ncbi:MAG: hypothetical protein JWO37_251 [Acidimicrobiales bacterium]|jgi:aminoglycoside phosphotransferase (APT) family kinase protein|nr:hypothetical protein [Acidimicrobiales bacterium]